MLLKPTIRKCKNARGRIEGYAASLGPVDVHGKTAADVVARCEGEAFSALARLDRGTSILSWNGHAIVVSPTVYGWRYWIDTFSCLSYSVLCSGTREETEDSALHHLAQNLWTLAADDVVFVAGLPSGVARKIAPWFVFQRTYAAAKAEGKSDSECHRIGCEASSRAPLQVAS